MADFFLYRTVIWRFHLEIIKTVALWCVPKWHHNGITWCLFTMQWLWWWLYSEISKWKSTNDFKFYFNIIWWLITKLESRWNSSWFTVDSPSLYRTHKIYYIVVQRSDKHFFYYLWHHINVTRIRLRRFEPLTTTASFCALQPLLCKK